MSDSKTPKTPKAPELQIELPAEAAAGHYSNLAIINHSGSEFYLDFIAVAPNMPQARVQTRVIMTPDNAKKLLFALRDNLRRYEATFGEIQEPTPKAPAPGSGEIPNPFIGGKA